MLKLSLAKYILFGGVLIAFAFSSSMIVGISNP